jgi:fluoride exporter
MTTFATLQFEVLNLIDTGHVALAAAYAVSSAACGLLAFLAAVSLVRRARFG